VLVTGGAGFIGSHVVDALLARGDEVTVLDVLHPQVHGAEQEPPAYLDPQARLVVGDVRDRDTLAPLLDEAEVVVHLAAYTGVGQSMYQVRDYLDVNVVGTGVLLELLGDDRRGVRALAVASSRAVYGEGAYRCVACGPVTPRSRTAAQLRAREWEPRCPQCGGPVTAVPTPEGSVPRPASVYAVSKQSQEQTALVVGAARDLPVVALRYFNVYGSRQSLSNPYTGVIPALVRRALSGRPPEVYEDGEESRDFVHVGDVVRATLLAIDDVAATGPAGPGGHEQGPADPGGHVLNVGSGERLSLIDVARAVATALNGPEPVVTGKFRVGDVRHSQADLTKVRAILGFEPAISFAEGIPGLVTELAEQLHEDHSARAEAELAARGLAARAE
jgi:dTDP-L-rhamnose 4-epimerase